MTPNNQQYTPTEVSTRTTADRNKGERIRNYGIKSSTVAVFSQMDDRLRDHSAGGVGHCAAGGRAAGLHDTGEPGWPGAGRAAGDRIFHSVSPRQEPCGDADRGIDAARGDVDNYSAGLVPGDVRLGISLVLPHLYASAECDEYLCGRQAVDVEGGASGWAAGD